MGPQRARTTISFQPREGLSSGSSQRPTLTVFAHEPGSRVHKDLFPVYQLPNGQLGFMYYNAGRVQVRTGCPHLCMPTAPYGPYCTGAAFKPAAAPLHAGPDRVQGGAMLIWPLANNVTPGGVNAQHLLTARAFVSAGLDLSGWQAGIWPGWSRSSCQQCISYYSEVCGKQQQWLIHLFTDIHTCTPWCSMAHAVLQYHHHPNGPPKMLLDTVYLVMTKRSTTIL